MGQQQLLLVLLVVLLVGVATIVAINTISNGNIQANRDAIRQDLLTATSSVQHIWERAYMLGGAGRNFQENFSDERLTELIEISGATSGTTITNENAIYTISTNGPNTVIIEAVPQTNGENMEIMIEKNSEAGWIFILNDGDATITNQPSD